MLAGNQTALAERSAASDRGVPMVFVDEEEILLELAVHECPAIRSHDRARQSERESPERGPDRPSDRSRAG